MDFSAYFSGVAQSAERKQRLQSLHDDLMRVITATPPCARHPRCVKFVLLWIEAKATGLPDPKDCSAWDELSLDRFPVFPPLRSN